MRKHYPVLVVLFFSIFSLQALAISPENKDRIKAEWELTQSEFLDFISTSETLKLMLLKNDPFSKTEILEALYANNTFPEFTDLQFDHALTTAKLRAALYRSNTYRADYIEGISTLVLAFENLLKSEASSLGESQMKLASINLKKQLEASIRSIEEQQTAIRSQIQFLTGRENARNKKRAELKVAALGIEKKKLEQQLKNEENGSRVSVQGVKNRIQKQNSALTQAQSRLTQIREAGHEALIHPKTKPDPISFLELGDASKIDLEKTYPKIYSDLVSGLFTDLDDLAEIPSAEVARYLKLIETKIPADNELNRSRIEATRKAIGLSVDQSTAFRNFLLSLIDVYQLEQKRRDQWTQLSESLKPVVTPIAQPTITEATPEPIRAVHAFEPVEVYRVLPALIDSVVIPKAGQAQNPKEVEQTPLQSKPVWKVEIKIPPRQNEGLSSHEWALFEELKFRLETKGPKIQTEAGSGFRNFGALGKRVYHCHVGSSSLVAIWSSKPLEKHITVLYLGEHPNTYKTILKKI